MTRMEAMAAIAQGVINIASGSAQTRGVIATGGTPAEVIERDSRIFRGMSEIVNREAGEIEKLREIERLLKRRGPNDARSALEVVDAMLKARIDPEFES